LFTIVGFASEDSDWFDVKSKVISGPTFHCGLKSCCDSGCFTISSLSFSRKNSPDYSGAASAGKACQAFLILAWLILTPTMLVVLWRAIDRLPFIKYKAPWWASKGALIALCVILFLTFLGWIAFVGKFGSVASDDTVLVDGKPRPKAAWVLVFMTWMAEIFLIVWLGLGVFKFGEDDVTSAVDAAAAAVAQPAPAGQTYNPPAAEGAAQY